MVIDVFYAIYTTCILDHDSRKVPVPSVFPQGRVTKTAPDIICSKRKVCIYYRNYHKLMTQKRKLGTNQNS